MSKKLKPCSICGSPAERVWDPEEELVKCSNEASSCHNAIYSMYLNEWQRRTIEDALEARVAELEAENAELKGRAENAEQMVSRLLEVGSALEAQAYDAWIKDGMLDFPAAKDWELLINEIKETKKESEK